MKPSFKLVEVLGLHPFISAPTQGPQDFVHCLLVEGQHSLLLIEVGMGTLDRVAPVHRLGLLHAPRLKRGKLQPLRQQLVSAGYRPDDVTDIFVSHLHIHHSGGLHDFPTARVHGLPHTLAEGCPRLTRLLPCPTYFTVPSADPSRFHGLRAYPLTFEDLKLSVVELPNRFAGHAGLLLPYHDGYLFHVGYAVRSLDELTEPLATARNTWSILTSKKPFSELETLTKLRRAYQDRKENLLFVSSVGTKPQLRSVNASLPELPLLHSEIDG